MANLRDDAQFQSLLKALNENVEQQVQQAFRNAQFEKAQRIAQLGFDKGWEAACREFNVGPYAPK